MQAHSTHTHSSSGFAYPSAAVHCACLQASAAQAHTCPCALLVKWVHLALLTCTQRVHKHTRQIWDMRAKSAQFAHMHAKSAQTHTPILMLVAAAVRARVHRGTKRGARSCVTPLTFVVLHRHKEGCALLRHTFDLCGTAQAPLWYCTGTKRGARSCVTPLTCWARARLGPSLPSGARAPARPESQCAPATPAHMSTTCVMSRESYGVDLLRVQEKLQQLRPPQQRQQQQQLEQQQQQQQQQQQEERQGQQQNSEAMTCVCSLLAVQQAICGASPMILTGRWLCACAHVHTHSPTPIHPHPHTHTHIRAHKPRYMPAPCWRRSRRSAVHPR